jgi:exoribonuclease II
MLRSLKQAMYSPDNVGHFGLAYESYTHFTSPIRRYPDLLIHRGIKAALAGEQYRPGDWEQIGLHCSMTERRADDATRDVVAFLKCYFMQDRVGEEFDRQRFGGRALRALRRARRRLCRGTGAHLRAGAATISITTRSATRWSASAPASASASPTACACNSCGSTWRPTRSTSASQASRQMRDR